MSISNTIGVIIGLIIIYFAAFALMSEPKTANQKIEEECKRSYGDRGETAVLECQLAMTVRFLNDADRNRANSTYNRIR